MPNTKARHKEIFAAAVKALEGAGGVKAVDALPQEQRRPKLQELASSVVEAAGCTRNAARNNVAKAMRRARYGLMEDRWGGRRPNQIGRPPLDEDRRRVSVSTRLAPGSKELAQAIAEALELDGWGRAVDLALERMAKDSDLKIKLARMGIVFKAKVNNESDL